MNQKEATTDKVLGHRSGPGLAPEKEDHHASGDILHEATLEGVHVTEDRIIEVAHGDGGVDRGAAEGGVARVVGEVSIVAPEFFTTEIEERGLAEGTLPEVEGVLVQDLEEGRAHQVDGRGHQEGVPDQDLKKERCFRNVERSIRYIKLRVR